MTKIKSIQKCALQFLFNDYTSDYEALLNESNMMEVQRLRVLALTGISSFLLRK